MANKPPYIEPVGDDQRPDDVDSLDAGRRTGAMPPRQHYADIRGMRDFGAEARAAERLAAERAKKDDEQKTR